MFSKIMAAGWFLFGWFQAAKRDKVVDFAEMVELVSGLVDIFEIPLRIRLPQSVDELSAAVAHYPSLKVEK